MVNVRVVLGGYRGIIMTIFIDSFSGNAAEIKPKDRTVNKLNDALKENPRISCFDLSENPWLCKLVNQAKKDGLINQVNEPYPWLKYIVVDENN